MSNDNNKGDTTVQPKETVTTPKKVYPYKKSKVVTIYPTRNKSILPEQGVMYNSAESYINRIGSSFAGPNTRLPLGRRVLSLDEEKKYMPSIIQVTPKSEHWEKALNDYWYNLSVSVPYEGLNLEVGVMVNMDNGVEIETPLNVRDYVLYRYCLEYSHVAKDKASIGRSTKIRFYISDPHTEKEEKRKIQKIRDQAVVTRLQLQKEVEVMYSILTVAKVNYIDLDDAYLKFEELANKKPQQFLAIAKDKDLVLKATIRRMLALNILQTPLDSNLILDGSTPIGGNLTEAAAWFKHPDNKVAVNVLQAKLKESR